ncbi:hypothetical protein HanXRQr2_Chr09g0409281 [Helianthus annuus]|uniref:Uncharacterized protein n=1 Tax=Helianthus annuus TaxID=4232 RepID=A0A9K3I9F3_HELAN|nr:hypothetical protein HanXRQr2_Chr09g0409281 [Helianthus annuus]
MGLRWAGHRKRKRKREIQSAVFGEQFQAEAEGKRMEAILWAGFDGCKRKKHQKGILSGAKLILVVQSA